MKSISSKARGEPGKVRAGALNRLGVPSNVWECSTAIWFVRLWVAVTLSPATLCVRLLGHQKTCPITRHQLMSSSALDCQLMAFKL